ncbi:MAG: hypothetical protein SGBAC_007357 [Bacillariaceae sp.]
MATVLMTKEVETVRSRFTEDDLFSLDDVPSKPSSKFSLFSDCGFSDDCLSDYAFSGHERGSFKDLESMYVEKEGKNLKSEKQKKQPSGSLEALLSPTTRKKTHKLKPGKRSSNLDALLSPTLSGKKKTAKRSSNLDALLSPTQTTKKKTAKLSSKSETNKSSDSSDQIDKKANTKRVSAPATCDGSRSEPNDTWWEIDEDEYETDTGDEFEYETDTADEYETDTDDEVLDGPASSGTAVSKAELVERALSMERSSMKRSLSKKRDILSLSNHRKGRKEEVLAAHGQSPQSPRNRSLSKQRTTDTLSLANHSKGKAETKRRLRKGSKRHSLLEGSASNLDDTPKRPSSLRNMKIVRRSSSAPKIKRKSFDCSSHSRSGDDDMSPLSAPIVKRKEKDNFDTSTRSDGDAAVTRRRSSQPSTPRRSLSHGTRRKQKGSCGSSVVLVARRCSSSKPRPSDPQLDSVLLSPGSTKLRRKIKRVSSTDDEVVHPESIQRTSLGSVQARRRSSSNKKTIKTRDASPSSKSQSRSSFRSTSLRVKGEEMAVVSRKLTNLSLSTSDHGGRSKRSSKAAKTSTVRNKRRYSTAI